MIEASQDAHEQREDAKNKTIMLRSRAEKDLSQVLQESIHLKDHFFSKLIYIFCLKIYKTNYTKLDDMVYLFIDFYFIYFWEKCK